MQLVVLLQVCLFEEVVGVVLLQWVGCGVQLIVVGEIVVCYVCEILYLWSEVGDEVVVLMGDFGGMLWIGVIMMVEYLILLLFVKFIVMCLYVKMYFKVGNCDDIICMFVMYEIDFVVMGSVLKELCMYVVEFVKYLMVFVVVFGYLLMQCKCVVLKDFEFVYLFVCECGVGMCLIVESLFKNVGYCFYVGFELLSNEVIKQMVEVGFGVVFLLLYVCVFEL